MKLLNWLLAGFLAVAPVAATSANAQSNKETEKPKIYIGHSETYGIPEQKGLEQAVLIETGRNSNQGILYLSIQPQTTASEIQVDLIAPDYFRIQNIEIFETIHTPPRKPQTFKREPNQTKPESESPQEKLRRDMALETIKKIPTIQLIEPGKIANYQGLEQALEDRGQQIIPLDFGRYGTQIQYFIHFSIIRREVEIEVDGKKVRGTYPPSDVTPPVTALVNATIHHKLRAQRFSVGVPFVEGRKETEKEERPDDDKYKKRRETNNFSDTEVKEYLMEHERSWAEKALQWYIYRGDLNNDGINEIMVAIDYKASPMKGWEKFSENFYETRFFFLRKNNGNLEVFEEEGGGISWGGSGLPGERCKGKSGGWYKCEVYDYNHDGKEDFVIKDRRPNGEKYDRVYYFEGTDSFNKKIVYLHLGETWNTATATTKFK